MNKTNLPIFFAGEMLTPCKLSAVQGKISSEQRGCLCLMRKAAGRWVVNSQVERRCTGTTVSLRPMGRGCIACLLNKQCSALGYCHQLKKTIKHKPLGAAPGRYEYTLVLFSYFWLGICCWSDTRLDKSLVWVELFLLFYGLVNCHPNSLY